MCQAIAGCVNYHHQLPLLFPNMKCIQLDFLMFQSVQLCVRKILPVCLPVGVIKTKQTRKTFSSYLCGWRALPSPWTTWSERYRAWNRVRCPPELESDLWSAPGTSLACRGDAPEPPQSGLGALSAPHCYHYWQRSHGSPLSTHSHRTAEGTEVTSKNLLMLYGIKCWYEFILYLLLVCTKPSKDIWG